MSTVTRQRRSFQKHVRPLTELLVRSLLVLGAVPLLIYPFVFLANMMSLAGHRSGNEPVGLVAVVYLFLLGSTAYPVVYFLCRASAIARMKQGEGKAAFGFSIAPLVYVGVLAALAVMSRAMQ